MVEPVLNLSAHEEACAMVGSTAVLRLLGKLAVELSKRFTDTSETENGRARLKQDAHALASSAGLLGFKHFSGLCCELEQQCSTGRQVENALSQVLDERQRVLHQIETMLTP